jgi:hypothetical protein
LLFRTVPSANTLVRWVYENAFASIVQARPCPTFGRPVHLRGSPHRLRPGTSPHALRIPPLDGHPALQRTAKQRLQVHLGCFRLSPSCPFRLLHTYCSLWPARHYPRLRIQHSSSERRRDFNPPEQCAAQRTLCPLLTSTLRSGCLATTSVASATQDRSPEVSSAAFCAQSPDLRFACLMDMDFAVSCPLVPRSRLISGSYPSTRAFAPRFFQTSPRGQSPCVSLTLHLHQVG